MLLTLGLTPAIQRVLVFDRYVPGEVNRAREVSVCAAGKAINAARAAKLLEPGREVLGLRPAARGSQDHFASLLAASGVREEAWPRREDSASGQVMRTCVTIIDRAGVTVTELVEESSPVDESSVKDVLDALRRAAPTTAIAAGTLAPRVADDFYAHALAAAPSARWIIDAKGPALLTALASGRGAARIAKLNTAELASSAHTPDITRGIRTLHDTGATHVIVTDGASQIFASDGARLERWKPPRVEVLNTTGCGDCLAGTFAMALERGDEFFSAVRVGIAASAASAETLVPSVFDLSRLHQFLQLLP